MKKILLFLLVFSCLKSFGQYPFNQFVANNDSTLGTTNAFRARAGFINGIYTDTTAANLTRIRQYPFSQIATSSDNKMWLRNATALWWIDITAPLATVTGAENGDTLVAGLIGQGGNLIRNTFITNTNSFDWRIQNIKKIGINQPTPVAALDILMDGVNSANQNDTTGIFLDNTTASLTSTDSLVSPPIILSANQRKTVPPAGSRNVRFRLDVLGAQNPLLRIKASVGGAAYVDVFSISNTGIIPENLNLNGAKIGIVSQANPSIRFGTGALEDITSGTSNIAIGASALANNTSGQYNTALGSNTLNNNIIGEYNTAIGGNSLVNNDSSLNTAIGFQSMITNTKGYMNTAVGATAMTFNTTGGKNAAGGAGAMESNTTGSFNSFWGMDAGLQNTTGIENVGMGWLGWAQNITGSYNVGLGSSSGRSVVNGNGNISIGHNSMYLNYAGANLQKDTVTNSIVIGQASYSTASNQMVLGNDSINQVLIKFVPSGAGTRALRYDPSTGRVTYSDTATGGGSGNTIYTGDGTLSGDRTVTMSANILEFTGAGVGIKLDTPNDNVQVSADNGILLVSPFVSMSTPATNNDTTTNKILTYNTSTNHLEISNWSNSGGAGSSDITVGTTVINSGTTTRILYDNAGVVGEYAVTGTGTTAVLSTLPTFTTGIVSPYVDLTAGATNGLKFGGTVRLYDDGTKIRISPSAGSLQVFTSGANATVSFFNSAGSSSIVFDASANNSIYGSVGNLNLGGTGSTHVIGVGVAAASATSRLHIAAGTTTLAPFGLTSGSLLTTPVAGKVEFLTDKPYFTITTGAARKEFTLNDVALTSGTTPVATADGRLTNGLILASAQSTPTLTDVANVTSSSVSTDGLIYSRTGSFVTATLILTVTPAVDATSTQVDFSLPIASNFAASIDLIGSGTAIGATYVPVLVSGSVANDRGIIQFTSTSTSAHTVSITFQYKII